MKKFLFYLIFFCDLTVSNGQTNQINSNIPVIVSFGKITKTGVMTIDEVKKVDSLNITNLEGNKSEYEIYGFNIVILGNGWGDEKSSSCNRLTDQQKKLIQHLCKNAPGSFYIEKIKVVKEGVIKEIGLDMKIKVVKNP